MDKVTVAEQAKDFKGAAVHAACEVLQRSVVSELVGMVSQVTLLVEPVVECGGLCGTPAVRD